MRTPTTGPSTVPQGIAANTLDSGSDRGLVSSRHAGGNPPKTIIHVLDGLVNFRCYRAPE